MHLVSTWLIFLASCTNMAVLQDVVVQLENTYPYCGTDIELRCQYLGSSACCSGTRIWKFEGNQIMRDGTAASSKYSEEIASDSKYFKLIISDAVDSDFGYGYTCEYSVFTPSAQYNLTISLCDCGICGGRNFGYSIIGTAFSTGVAVGITVYLGFQLRYIVIIGVTSFLASAAINLAVTLPVAYKVCNCNENTDPAFISLGLGTAGIIAFVMIIVLKHKAGKKSNNGYEMK